MYKKSCIVVLLMVAGMSVVFAGGKAAKKTGNAEVSYAFGVVQGNQLKEIGEEIGVDFSYDEFIKGFKAAMNGKPTNLSADEAMTFIQTAIAEIQEAEAAKNRELSAAFLEENKTKSGIQVTESGLQYEVIHEGTGIKPVASDTVKVHYEGRLIDGTVFDSSRERGEPVEFPLDGVIPGWSEGLQLMNVGSSYKLYVPDDLGYGEWGAGDIIPPYSALIFEVELLEILKGR